ncbi:MAG: hypothetical protein DRN15_02890 [Thermoprotei archaeon]|nr:MAG: hypothetical protein DRM97_08230 [Thermoprotei archaeon]RLF24350.1 MAG: hypothetical protein DRN15_02890 [Thermoprotei archaeon]
MEIVKLLLDCHKLLLSIADKARNSELAKSKAFEYIIEANEKIASALTRLRMEGLLDPEDIKLLEEAMESIIR